MKHRLRVNPIACEAHGLCAELVPELIHLDEWGYPIVAEAPVPSQLEKHARRAVAACPSLALLLAPAEESSRRSIRPTPSAQGNGRAPDGGRARPVRAAPHANVDAQTQLEKQPRIRRS